MNNIKKQKIYNYFFERIYNFLDDIIKNYSDKNVLIVTHGGVSIPIACYFNKNIPTGSLVEAGLVLGNCQVYLILIVQKISSKKFICDF